MSLNISHTVTEKVYFTAKKLIYINQLSISDATMYRNSNFVLVLPIKKAHRVTYME